MSTTKENGRTDARRPNMPGTGPTGRGVGGLLDRYFGIAAAGSTLPREVRAGLVTFLACAKG